MLRKLTSLALCIILCVAAAVSPACAEETAPAEKITKIEQAVAEGGDKALWDLVNTRYATNRYVEEGCAELYILTSDNPVFPNSVGDDKQLMNCYWINITDIGDVGFTLEKILAYTVQPDGTCKAQDLSPEMLSDGGTYIAPGFATSYRFIQPAYETGRYAIIAVAGTDDNGHELEFYSVIELLNNLLIESAASASWNSDYDIGTLRHDAEYQMIVSDGVWWVPVSTLGRSRYTNREIAAMVNDTPEQKQEEISTLYEALQLFMISGFTYSSDNVKILEDGINWEHHKPGYDAVRTNTGCCAADSGWLNYILDGDYEQMGFLAYTQADGNGHVINYIFSDGYYYFIDPMGFEESNETATAYESGRPRDYIDSGYVTGCLMKARSPEDFVNYLAVMYSSICRFFLYQAENVPPVTVSDVDGVMTITYPEEYDIKVMDGLLPERLGVRSVPGPQKTYDWSFWKTVKIKARDKYLPGEEKTDAEPLTAYQPGDVLTLEDGNDKGQAVIDGIKFATSKRDLVRINFEDNLYLEGRHVNGVYDLSLSLDRHGDAIKDMNSLVLGEMNVAIVRKIPEAQVVICTREGDQLAVQEVLDGQYYDSSQISIRRDESGAWQETPDYWYLVITRMDKVKYEFGRFHCGIADET